MLRLYSRLIFANHFATSIIGGPTLDFDPQRPDFGRRWSAIGPLRVEIGPRWPDFGPPTREFDPR